MTFFRRLFRTVFAPPQLTEPQRKLLRERAPWSESFHDDEKERFELHLRRFLATKDFQGKDGIEVTEEMRVLVAATAARLSRNIGDDVYDRLDTIIMHDSAVFACEDHVILGTASTYGVVDLSWNAVTHGLDDTSDGHDTALHEFAHIIDMADGDVDGTPDLHRVRDYHSWTAALSGQYLALREKVEKGPLKKNSVLRAYGATNEAEFFAVACEAFFERPFELRDHAPDLYRELERFFRVDPTRFATRERQTKHKKARGRRLIRR